MYQCFDFCLRGLFLTVVCLAAGCGAGGPRHPVEGRVLIDGKPLAGKGGTVLLKPDPSKGNPGNKGDMAFGILQPDGSFNIETNGVPGAAPGWYKVVVMAYEPDSNPNEESIRALDQIYEKENTTPLTIEVVASPSPGRYDLQVKLADLPSPDSP